MTSGDLLRRDNDMNPAEVTLEDNLFCIRCQTWDNPRAQAIPDRKWSNKNGRWEIPITLTNAKYINSKYQYREIMAEAGHKIDEIIRVDAKRAPFPMWYKFKAPPSQAQSTALDLTFTKDEFALIMDMGTGKTFVSINFACAKAMMGDINGMLVIPETTGKPVWRKEFEKFCTIDYDMYILEAGKQKQARNWIDQDINAFKVLVIGVEALSTGPYAREIARTFVGRHNTYMVIDESSSIKNPAYKKGRTRQSRTHVCWDLGGLSKYRHILNGTPIEEGVEDFFSQFRFLDWGIIGEKNFTLFKGMYCEMGGFQGRKIVGYRNLDNLFEKIEPYIFSVRIEDIEDMPPESYETVYCEPTPEQKKALAELGDPMMTTTQGDLTLVAESVLERMTRYQQIVGGHFPYDLTEEERKEIRKSDPRHKVTRIKGKNPKMEALFATLDKLKGRKVVIWAYFAPERLDIVDELDKMYPWDYLHMGSGMTSDEKYVMMELFQKDPEIKYLITSQRIAAKSVTLHAATCNIYYSNGHSYAQRLQSQRRIWRKGQKHPCLYIDITMNEKTDLGIVESLRNKKSISEYVLERLQSSVQNGA